MRQQRLLDDDARRARWPLLREAARYVGYLETRRRGTVGGSLAFAAPWAELTAAAVALDAAIDVRSARGERTIAARDFFRGPHETALEPDELIMGRASRRRPRARAPASTRSAPATATTPSSRPRARHRRRRRCTAAELVLLRVADTPYRVDADGGAWTTTRALDELLADHRPARRHRGDGGAPAPRGRRSSRAGRSATHRARASAADA